MGLGSLFKRNKKDKKEEKVDESHIDIDIGSCDGCEKCVVACSNNVFMLVDETCCVRDHQVCRNCKVCMAICPNDCITVN